MRLFVPDWFEVDENRGSLDNLLLIVRAICGGKDVPPLQSETFSGELVLFEVPGGTVSVLLVNCTHWDKAATDKDVENFRRELRNGKVIAYRPESCDAKFAQQPDLTIRTLPDGSVWPDRDAVMAFLQS